MSRIKNAFYWLRGNFKAIMVFITILAMGAGIAPTIRHGAAFVEALQYEKMVETNPPHIIAREAEAELEGMYVLAVDESAQFAVVWILPVEMGEDGDPANIIYTLFALLDEHYPNREAYYIVVAEVISVVGVDGPCTMIRGLAEYGISLEGMRKLLGWGKANANNSLDLLFAEQKFGVSSFYYSPPYLKELLQREAGHVPPWEE